MDSGIWAEAQPQFPHGGKKEINQSSERIKQTAFQGLTRWAEKGESRTR